MEDNVIEFETQLWDVRGGNFIVLPVNWLEQCEQRIHRIGQKYPIPCKEMVQEAVDFICPKQDNFPRQSSREYNDDSYLQRYFSLTLYEEHYTGQELKFVETWNKYAPSMLKENNHFFCCKAVMKR